MLGEDCRLLFEIAGIADAPVGSRAEIGFRRARPALCPCAGHSLLLIELSALFDCVASAGRHCGVDLMHPSWTVFDWIFVNSRPCTDLRSEAVSQARHQAIKTKV